MSEGREEWISAVAARAMGPSGTNFSHTIIERAKVGLVNARTKLLVWNRQGQQTEQSDCDLPKEFWRHGVEAENWDQGDFGVLWNRSEHSWMAGSAGWEPDSYAYGVTFARADIEAMLPAAPISVSLPVANMGRPKGSGGFAVPDAILVEKMREYITANPDKTPHFAAGQFAEQADGNAGLERKQRRLSDRYRKAYSN